jgi:hypothetical protein
VDRNLAIQAISDRSTVWDCLVVGGGATGLGTAVEAASRGLRVLNESQTGICHHHFYQQPTFGFVSVVYLAETQCCLPLFDRQHLLSEFKRRVEIYPSPLQARLTKDCLSMAEFTFIHAFGFAQRGDIFNMVGSLTRIAFMLAQALFA